MAFAPDAKSSKLVTQRALARVERNRKHLIGELRRAHESKIESAKAANKQWKEKVKEAIEAGRKAPEMPADAEIPEPFVAPRLCVSDSTIEKLAVLLQARPHGMLVIRDELAGLFLNLARYSGGTDKEFWLEAWNGKPVETGRFASAAVTDNGRPHGERFEPRFGSPYTSRYSNQARSNAKKRHNNMIDAGAGAVSGIRPPLLPTWRQHIERERWQFTATII